MLFLDWRFLRQSTNCFYLTVRQGVLVEMRRLWWLLTTYFVSILKEKRLSLHSFAITSKTKMRLACVRWRKKKWREADASRAEGIRRKRRSQWTTTTTRRQSRQSLPYSFDIAVLLHAPSIDNIHTSIKALGSILSCWFFSNLLYSHYTQANKQFNNVRWRSRQRICVAILQCSSG